MLRYLALLVTCLCLVAGSAGCNNDKPTPKVTNPPPPGGPKPPGPPKAPGPGHGAKPV